MLIWRGNGFLVFIIVFLSSFVANLLANTLGGEAYWENNGWPFALSLFASSCLVYCLHIFLSKQPTRTLIDKDTGEEITFGDKHDLFFVPVKWWSAILAIAFGIALLSEFVSFK